MLIRHVTRKKEKETLITFVDLQLKTNHLNQNVKEKKDLNDLYVHTHPLE